MINIEYDKNKRIKRIGTIAKQLKREHVLDAIEEFHRTNGLVESYHPSTGYDLIHNKTSLPPKAIFGLALAKLIKTPVYSNHFTGGEGSPCFKTLRGLGFSIIEKARPSEADGLKLYKTYTREMLSQLYDPEINFKPGSGKWGITGIVKNTPVENDFVFIVTLDENAGGNNYEDYLTEDGVLVWKSQNRSTPKDSDIQQLLRHDDSTNNILLFLRANEGDEYTFMGPLAYKDWDRYSTNPVQISWSLKCWPLPPVVESQFIPMIRPAMSPWYRAPERSKTTILNEVAPPKYSSPTQKKKSKSMVAQPNWAEIEKRNRDLGLDGELAVIKVEKEKLINAELSELADKVEHTALLDPSAGYDIRSFDESGDPIYIEVKTTTSGVSTPFFISKNEVEVSEQLSKQYWIYRVFDFLPTQEQLNLYKLNGSSRDILDLEPVNYKAMPGN